MSQRTPRLSTAQKMLPDGDWNRSKVCTAPFDGLRVLVTVAVMVDRGAVEVTTDGDRDVVVDGFVTMTVTVAGGALAVGAGDEVDAAVVAADPAGVEAATDEERVAAPDAAADDDVDDEPSATVSVLGAGADVSPLGEAALCCAACPATGDEQP